jgi:hypothetical protein
MARILLVDRKRKSPEAWSFRALEVLFGTTKDQYMRSPFPGTQGPGSRMLRRLFEGLCMMPLMLWTVRHRLRVSKGGRSVPRDQASPD